MGTKTVVYLCLWYYAPHVNVLLNRSDMIGSSEVYCNKSAAFQRLLLSVISPPMGRVQEQLQHSGQMHSSMRSLRHNLGLSQKLVSREECILDILIP